MRIAHGPFPEFQSGKSYSYAVHMDIDGTRETRDTLARLVAALGKDLHQPLS
jgi:hypothetical protein